MTSDDYGGGDRCSCTESIFAQRRLNDGSGGQCRLRGLPGSPTSKSRLLFQYLENQLRSTLSAQAVERDLSRIDDSSSDKERLSSCMNGDLESCQRRSVKLYENLPPHPCFVDTGHRSTVCSGGSAVSRDLEATRGRDLEATGGRDLQADGTGSRRKALSHVIKVGVRTRFSSTESEKDFEPEEESSRRYPVPESKVSLDPAVAPDPWTIGCCVSAPSSGSQLSPTSCPNDEGPGRDASSTRRDLDAVECPRRRGLYRNHGQVLPYWDLEQLQLVHYRLSICGFYWGRMTMDDARTLLDPYPVGTFLLRDSSDARYLFSLSVQTQRGTTSIRIVYECGLFRMDSEPDQRHLMPTFDCVLRIIQYYRRLCLGRGYPAAGRRSSYVFLESSGRRDTRVLLRRPVELSPRRLVHICRLRIHGVLRGEGNGVARLPLTPSLKIFLMDYPYDV